MHPAQFALRQLLDLAPPDMHPYLVVAGGYLASPEKAKDIDLWLLAGDQHQQATAQVYEHLHPLLDAPAGFNEFTLHPLNNISPAGFATTPPEYEASLKAKNIFYVGTFQKPGWPLPVQVFVTPYTSVQELLADFDISTHQWATRLLPLSSLEWAPTATPTSAMPRVTNWSTPSTTLARLEKLSHRYGFSLAGHPDADTLRRLLSDTGRLDVAA